MNWRSTGILLTAAVVFLAFLGLVERPTRQAKLRQSSHFILPGFDPASVNMVEVKVHGGGEIQAGRMGGSNVWRLNQPFIYPAQTQPIEQFLQSLTNLQWQGRIAAAELKDQPDAQEKFGFTQPQFELSLHGSGAPRELLIGQSSALGDEVFVEVVGNPDIYLVDSAWLPLIPSDKDQWRNTGLLNLGDMDYNSLRVTALGKEFDLERDATNHLWRMTKPVTARANSELIDQYLSQLQALRVKQFVSEGAGVDLDPYGFQTAALAPPLELSFLRGSNQVEHLQTGAGSTNFPGLVFARRLDPSNVVLIDPQVLLPWAGSHTNFLDYHLIDTPPAAVASIAVMGEGAFVARRQTNGTWRMEGGTNFLADAGLMQDWLDALTNIQVATEKTVATELGVYGLTNPAVDYVVRQIPTNGQSNSIVAEIQFGTNRSGRVFERRTDEVAVNRISLEDYQRLPHAAWQLQDRGIWSFDSSNVVSLTIHQSGAKRKYVRDPEGEWTFAPGYHGPPWVNWPALEEGMHRLGQLRAVYWSAMGAGKLKEFGFAKADFSLELEIQKDGRKETKSIQFGGRSAYSYPYAAVVLHGQTLIFEFPVDLYENFIDKDMSIPAALRYYR